MNHLLWWLQRRGAPYARVAGLALVAAALALQWLAVEPLRQQVEVLQTQRERRDATLERMNDALARQDTPQAQLDAFYGHFAQAHSLPGGLERLHAIARSHQLEMARAQYHLSHQPGQPLDRYRMTLPIHGSYTTLRAFVTTALRELPTLALDQIQLQRQDIADGALDAQITFTFYLAR
jgi:heme exporter protein D